LQFKGKVGGSVSESGIEDHTFEPKNAVDHFPEDKLTLGKSRLCLNFCNQ